MKGLLWIGASVLLPLIFALSSCAVQQEEARVHSTERPPEVKVKPVKASGDVGLLDLEKNYLILVTKEGKLITADFTEKSRVTKLIPHKAKVSDINLGQSATVTYTKKGEKSVATSIEYVVKAKKGE